MVKSNFFRIVIVIYALVFCMITRTQTLDQRSRGQLAGQQFAKALADSTVETFTPKKKPKKVQPIIGPEEQFLITIFEGKKVPIVSNALLNDARMVRLLKTQFHITPLMAALIGKQSALLELLLMRGADPDVPNKDGLTVLHMAARIGDTATVQKLLDFGADPSVTDRTGMTPLHYAVMKNRNGDHYGVIKTLLENKADVNVQNNKGITPLIFAAMNNDYKVVKKLLKNNARALLSDDQGKTAYDYAKDPAIEDLLLDSMLDFGSPIYDFDGDGFGFGAP